MHNNMKVLKRYEEDLNIASMNRMERAKYYVEKLNGKPTEEQARQIARDINALVYSKSGEALSCEDKIAIAVEMERQLGEQLVLEHADNQAVLDLISLVRRIVTENK